MKRISTFILLLFLAGSTSYSQFFLDNFEGYTVGSYIGPNSSDWTTWSGVEGGAEDVQVVNTDAYSGTKSIYFASAGGNGPQDVVLPFGGVHSSGRFKFSAKFKIPSNNAAYFNFQGGASVAQIWSMQIYFYSAGNFNITGGSGGTMAGTYPQGQWFDLVFDVDLTTDLWTMYIDNIQVAQFTNTNNISYLDLFPADPNSYFWVDDVSYCVGNACNPDLSIDNITLNPNPVCTHKSTDVTVEITNHGPAVAEEMLLAVDIAGQPRVTQMVKLDLLPVGEDTIITLVGMLNPGSPGTALTVKGINLQGDNVPANDTGTTTINILPSPSGAELVKGTPFTTARPVTFGTAADPDIVAKNDVLTYELNPPGGFTNSGFGTTWNTSTINITTAGGTTVPTSQYSITPPSSSGNGIISFEPDASLTDSNVLISFSVVDLANSCDSTINRHIYIAPRPVAGFNAPAVCDKEAMTFTNTSTISTGSNTYSWDFGDGNTSDLSDPQHTYATYGTYTVKLFATSDYGYVDSSIQQVTVHQLPVAEFETFNACEGDPVKFHDISFIPSGTPTYSWDFGDGNTSALADPTNLYVPTGVYRVMMTVTANGCSSSRIHYATQAPRAVVDFTAVSGICNNKEVPFTNNTTLSSGTVGYTWDFGDNTISSLKDPKHTYTGFGSFDVTLFAYTDLGCKDSFSTTINLIEAPVAMFGTGGLCDKDNVAFINNSLEPAGSLVTYTWDFGSGTPVQAKDPVHAFGGSGQYEVTLLASADNGCEDELKQIITIGEKPNAAFVAADVCEGKAVNFLNSSVSSEQLSYHWDFGNGNTSALANPVVNYSTANSYNVQLVATTGSGCSDTATAVVMVKENPLDTITSISSGMDGKGTMIFTADVEPNSSYIWFFGDGNTESGTSTTGALTTTHRYMYDANFEVILHVTKDGCQSENIAVAKVFKTGMADLQKAALRVYPNPSSGLVNIDLSGINGEVQSLEIYSSSGSLVQTLNNRDLSSNGSLQVNLTGNAAGIYLVKLITPDAVYNAKINLNK